MRVRSAGFMVVGLLLLGACGGSSTAKSGARSTTAPGGASRATSTTTAHSASRPGLTMQVTGVFSFHGTPSGQITCVVNKDGRLRLQALGAPRLTLGAERVQDGSIQVLDADQVSGGSLHYPADSTAITSLTIAEGGPNDVSTYVGKSGTVTISSGGTSGSMEVNAGIPGDLSGQVHVSATWKNCSTAAG